MRDDQELLRLKNENEKLRKRIEELEFRSQLLDQIEDRITATDLQGNITYANQAEYRSFGDTAGSLIGKNVREFGEDSSIGASQQEIINSTLENGFWTGRVANVTSDDSMIIFNSRTRLIYDKSGNPAGMVGISTDITEIYNSQKELQESEELFRTIFSQSAVGISLVSTEGVYLQGNAKFSEITGYSSEEMKGFNFADITNKEDLRKEQVELAKMLKGRINGYNLEKRITNKKGEVIWIHLYVNVVKDRAGQPKYWIATIIDRTRQVFNTQKLANLSNRLTLALKSAEIGIWELDIKSGRLIWDSRMFSLYGINPETVQIDFDVWRRAVHPEDIEAALAGVTGAIEGEKEFDMEFRILWSDGSIHYIKASAITERDMAEQAVRMVGVNYDITEIRCTHQELQSALDEKEILLKELYHRTKNNMQVICSMLDMEAMNQNNETINQVFTEMGQRIQTMSLVHNKLYQSNNLSRIDLKDYIEDLAFLLIRSNTNSELNIKLTTSLINLNITIEIAIPLGLILNELITNSLKYAFPGRRHGMISISLELSEKYIIITYKDDGVGFPEDFNITRDQNLGLLLVQKLVSGQLNGQFRYDSENGLAFQIRFFDINYRERV
ncbi:MAG: PAS domain S-box protein [Candidatus Cloacimonetes bacterium]|nr:PAS domain S-box protein [Candidatus Cloacimonadota bacterium]